MFLYFRQRAQQWVLDDLVDADGAVYAHTMGADVTGPWLSTPSWRTDARIKVSSCFDVKGYRGEAVRVSGARGEFLSNAAERDLVDSCSTQDNGTYLRQPPYEDIDGPSSCTLRLRLRLRLRLPLTRISYQDHRMLLVPVSLYLGATGTAFFECRKTAMLKVGCTEVLRVLC